MSTAVFFTELWYTQFFQQLRLAQSMTHLMSLCASAKPEGQQDNAFCICRQKGFRQGQSARACSRGVGWVDTVCYAPVKFLYVAVAEWGSDPVPDGDSLYEGIANKQTNSKKIIIGKQN